MNRSREKSRTKVLSVVPLAAALVGLWGVVLANDDPLAAWRSGVKIHPVSPRPGRHTIHSYFNVSPESPDGSWVLFFSSATPEGENGEVCLLNRRTGEEKVLARNIATEDAHRVACQQWVSRGKRVAFHDFQGQVPVVVVVDTETLKRRVAARGWLVGWGQANSDLVPIYPPHWKNSSGETDLKLLNAATGEVRTLITAQATRAAYPEQIRKVFGDKPITLFFPALSPDGKRIFFKLASPLSEDFKSGKASLREMLIVYDLEHSRFLSIRDRWGHPDWNPDSRRILNTPNVFVDSETGQEQPIPGLPQFPGQHPTSGSNGRIFATDVTARGQWQGPRGQWGVAVADVTGNNFVVLKQFDNSLGAKSWRVSHPHPAFSADCQRLYFNESSTQWTQVYVAESRGR